MKLLSFILILLPFLLFACNRPQASAGKTDAPSRSQISELVCVTMHTTKGEIVLVLDPARAPISVDNFLAHASNGDYDGTIFHRVIPTFVIQGGGFTPDLQDRGKLAESLGHKDVPISNEWNNGLKNYRGTIAMARDSAPDTATREFYINVADNPKLDSPRETTGNAGYAVFGYVVFGMDIVDQIKDGATTSRPDILVDGEGMKDVPVEPVTILKVVKGWTIPKHLIDQHPPSDSSWPSSSAQPLPPTSR